jgi:alcohol dehydrogenase YqhD (iron-dependent ADH family)
MKFEYHNPTRLVFGAGSLSRLGELAQLYGKRPGSDRRWQR